MPKRDQVPLRVIKSSLDPNTKTNYSKNFTRMPTLYLELIENQNKIKPIMIGKSFVPTYKETEPRSISNVIVENTKPVEETKTVSKPPVYSPRDDSSDDAFSITMSNSQGSRPSQSPSPDRSPSPQLDDEDDEDDGDNEDELTKHLKGLLREETGGTKANIFPTHATPSPLRSIRSKKRTPPTLEQLKANVQIESPPINVNMENEEDKKRTMLFKFDLLRKSYKDADIPEYSIHTDLHTIEKSYDILVKRLQLDSTVESYKTYLIGGFMVVEYILGNWCKLDMQGFTQQQIMSMNSYEKLLVELGEKSYVPEAKQWSVEIRLLFLILMNAAFFLVSKMILRKTGANLMNMMNSMGKSNTPSPQPRVSKRKMKGPTINLDEIPEFGT